MNKRLLTGLAAVALGSLLSAPALAGGVSWSVGINAPIGPGVSLGTVISGGRAPVWVQPAPVVYAPQPAYYPEPAYYPAPVYSPPPVVYAPAPVYYPAPVYRAAPRRVVYAPVPVYVRPGHPRWERGHDHDHDGYRDAPHRGNYGPVAYNDGRPGR